MKSDLEKRMDAYIKKHKIDLDGPLPLSIPRSTKVDKLRKFVEELPYGSVIKYKNELYFKSEWLETDSVTNTRGRWQFISEIKWYGVVEVMYRPSKRWKR